MLTAEELAALQSLLARASISAAEGTVAASSPLAPGDVVQLRPGIDRTWESSLILVTRVDGYRCRGQVLRPHRSGCAEAAYQFRPGEVVRIGRAPYPEPGPDIRRWSYCPPCPVLGAESKVVHKETRGRKKTAAEIVPEISVGNLEFPAREITAVYRDEVAASNAAIKQIQIQLLETAFGTAAEADVEKKKRGKKARRGAAVIVAVGMSPILQRPSGESLVLPDLPPTRASDADLAAAARDLRKRFGLGQKEFAAKLGVSLGTISKFEGCKVGGRRQPGDVRRPTGKGLAKLLDLADANDCSDLGDTFHAALSCDLGYAIPRRQLSLEKAHASESNNRRARAKSA